MSVAQRPPAFQFYPKDWDTDQNVIPMTYEEEGVYFALCRRYWLEGNALPNDLEVLRALLKGRPSLKKMQGWWKVIGRCFQVDGGLLKHKKLDALRAEQIANKKKRQDAAAERWERAKQMHSTPTGDAMQSLSSASSSASSSAVQETPPFGRQPVQGPGAFAPGSLPRDHKNHALCGKQFRLCLSYKVFGTFVARYGGPESAAEAALQSFVNQLEVDHQSIGDYLWLENHFTAYLRTAGRLKDADGPRLNDRPVPQNDAHEQVLKAIKDGTYGR